jgi:phosphatidylglycerophosphatase A
MVVNPRKVIRWERLQSSRSRAAFFWATACGVGLFPIASGTAGTVVGIPIHWLSAGWDVTARILLWAVLFGIGVWAARVVDEAMGSGDHSCIVLDEVVGYGITAWTCGVEDWRALAAAFFIFRFFDIVKPWPVRRIDVWSKKKSLEGGSGNWWGGFGVMADDLAAALMGLVLIMILQRSGWWF